MPRRLRLGSYFGLIPECKNNFNQVLHDIGENYVNEHKDNEYVHISRYGRPKKCSELKQYDFRKLGMRVLKSELNLHGNSKKYSMAMIRDVSLVKVKKVDIPTQKDVISVNVKVPYNEFITIIEVAYKLLEKSKNKDSSKTLETNLNATVNPKDWLDRDGIYRNEYRLVAPLHTGIILTSRIIDPAESNPFRSIYEYREQVLSTLKKEIKNKNSRE